MSSTVLISDSAVPALPAGMALVFAPEAPEPRAGAGAGAGQSVDLRPKKEKGTKPKRRPIGPDYRAVMSVIDMINACIQFDIRVVTEFQTEKVPKNDAQKTTLDVVHHCRSFLRTAQELWKWNSVPMRKTAHTLPAARACVDYVLACLHTIITSGRLPRHWLVELHTDYSVVVAALAAALGAGQLPPLPLPLAESEPEDRLVIAKSRARDAIVADRSAWLASPWSKCGPAPVRWVARKGEYWFSPEDGGVAPEDAITARMAVLEHLVSPAVLQAARDVCDEFVTKVLADLDVDIKKQVAAKDCAGAMAVFEVDAFKPARPVRMRKVPGKEVFKPAMPHGLLWGEMPRNAYPAWFPKRWWLELQETVLPRVQYLLVSNSVASDAAAVAFASAPPKDLLPACTPLGFHSN